MVYWNICYQVSSLCCPHQPCRVTSEHSSSAPILDVNYEYPPMKQQMWLLFFWNFFNILKTWPQSVFFKFHQRFFFILRFPFYWKFNIDVRYTLYIFVYLNYFLNIGGDWLGGCWCGLSGDLQLVVVTSLVLQQSMTGPGEDNVIMSFFMSNARRNPKEEARYRKEVILVEQTLSTNNEVGDGHVHIIDILMNFLMKFTFFYFFFYLFFMFCF